MIHRGTANRSPEPRPVVVVSLIRSWYRHSGFERIGISPGLRATLGARLQALLRLHLDPLPLA